MSAATLDPVASASRDAAFEDAVLRDNVRALYAQAPQGIAIGFVIGAVFVYVFLHRVGPAIAWGWYGVLCAAQFFGWWRWHAFDRLQAGTDWNPRTWRRSYSVRAWVAGLLLGSMAWLFYAPEFGDARWFTVLMITGIAGGSVTSYAYHLPTLYGFLLLLCFPLWVRLAQMPGPATWVAAGMFFFYLLMVAWFGRNQGQLLQRSIRQRLENQLLVKELQAKSASLQEANAAKSRFFAAASHDLRQPLQALGYYSTLLQPHAQDAPLVERIQQCVDALDGLLEGVLSISRLDAGKVQAQPAAVDLSQLLSRLQTQYQGMALAKGLTLQLVMSSRASPWVNTDPLLLERVVGNLLHNALRYTLHGGVLLAVRPHSDGVQLRVIDTGLGIAAADQVGIFDEFTQLNNPQRDATQGVGLGLATVKRLCALLGHPLAVRSGVGQGSAFSLLLPACAAPTAPVALAPQQVDSQMKGCVLVVEDNPLVRDALQGSLQRWGLSCDVFADGVSALAQARQTRYDAAISDWRLPGDLNGTEVLAQLRALQPTLAVAILLTGELDADSAHLQEGIHLLQKPLRPLRLRALLSAHLSAA